MKPSQDLASSVQGLIDAEYNSSTSKFLWNRKDRKETHMKLDHDFEHKEITIISNQKQLRTIRVNEGCYY